MDFVFLLGVLGALVVNRVGGRVRYLRLSGWSAVSPGVDGGIP